MSDKTICTTCLRLKQGLCDGEKELTACPSYKRMTNGDRIRAMTDEELAEFMICVAQQGGIPLGGQPIRWLDWLKQEVTDNGWHSDPGHGDAEGLSNVQISSFQQI